MTWTPVFTTILFYLLLFILTDETKETIIATAVIFFVALAIWFASNFNHLCPHFAPRRARTRRARSTIRRQSNGVIPATVRAEREQYRYDPEIGLPSSCARRKASIAAMAIKALPPVKSFTTEDKDGGSDQRGDEECPICMERFKEMEFIQPFGLCNHQFHLSCLYSWLNRGNSTCPVCRRDLATSKIKANGN